MIVRSRFTRSLVLATATVATLAMSPAGPASAGAIPDPNTQYQRISYHSGSRTGPVIGEYNYAGPCGEAYWWGSTSSYTTTSWVTCPGM
ncbi:MAG TPA: hypothetical protein VGX49_04465 [Jatrophihabitans sp.]|jgi:hypothetical protein|nr:hypothetical protein [Jatrophihabitans sp.]